MKFTFLGWIFLLITMANVSAFDSYRFRTMSPEGGLDADGVKSISQDKNGFMWFVFSEKLIRFDGFNYKNFSDKLTGYNQEKVLIRFNSIFKDSDGDLYLATSVGVFKYNYLLNSFSLFNASPTIQIAEDSNKNLWFVDREISFFNKDRQTSAVFIPEKKEVLNQNNTICTDNSGNVFVSVDFGKISVVKGNNKEVSFLYAFPENTRIISIHILEKKLWILTETKGIFVLDITTKQIISKYTFFLNENDNQIPARTFYIDQLKNIWVGTQQGLYIHNQFTAKTFQYLRQNNQPFSIVNNSIWSTYEDVNGNLWIGTYLGGISFYAPSDRNQFKTFSQTQYGFPSFAVSSFAKDNGTLWFGTEGNGIFSYNQATGSIVSLVHNNSRNSLKYNNVKSLLLAVQSLWIGMYRGGLDELNLKTGVFKNFNANDSDKRIVSNDISKMVHEADSGMWIIYQSGGPMLTYFSFTNPTSQHYFLNSKDNTTANYRIVDLVKGSDSHLWLATAKSVVLFDTRHRRVVRYIELPNKNNKNSALNIRAIHYDNGRKCLWIGTQQHGLIKYNFETESDFDFSNSTLSPIQSITQDKIGSLWLGTETGISRFHPESQRLLFYNNNDGIHSSLLYPRSVYIDKAGIIYFGGTEGFSYFNAEKITENTLKPKLLVADIQINNQSVLSDTAFLKSSTLLSDNKLELSYNENNIGIELSSSNYLMPAKSRYKYRMRGYNNDWTEVDAARRYVLYPKLSSGKYVFEAMAANNDGIWGDVYQLRVVVQPPFWLSPIAFLFYLLVIGAMVYWLYRNKINNERYKNEIFLAECRKKDQEESHQARLRFFTNITHDFKTPLTMIQGTLDYIETEKYNLPQLYIDSLKNNSKRLLALVNEVIDFRTIENGMMKIKLQPLSFNDIVRNCAEEMRIYAYQKNLNFKLSIHSINEQILLDKPVVEKIIFNLLDNAIKYTDEKGTIRIETYKNILDYKTKYAVSHTEGSFSTDKEMVGFVVSDTGVGISGESIARVFDRFFRVEDDNELHLGSGIGLALVRSLVLLHEGFITIASQRELGTDFIVGLPLKAGNVQSPSILSQSEEIIIKNEIPAEIRDFATTSFSSKKRILCVEDNVEISMLISNNLKASFDVVTASNGEEALSILSKIHIDLIISDWMMPVMDGVALCKSLKKNPVKSYIPFILMTVKSGINTQLEVFDAGAEAYIEKPINFKLLFYNIQNLLNLKENTRLHFAETHFVDSHSTGLNQEKNKTFEKLLEIIQRDLTKSEINVEQVAQEMNMSRRKLYNFIKENSEKSIVEFIRSYRLNVAAKLMLEQNKSVKETMSLVGMESQSYFIKAFKKEFGDSPSAFLSKMRKIN